MISLNRQGVSHAYLFQAEEVKNTKIHMPDVQMEAFQKVLMKRPARKQTSIEEKQRVRPCYLSSIFVAASSDCPSRYSFADTSAAGGSARV